MHTKVRSKMALRINRRHYSTIGLLSLCVCAPHTILLTSISFLFHWQHKLCERARLHCSLFMFMSLFSECGKCSRVCISSDSVVFHHMRMSVNKPQECKREQRRKRWTKNCLIIITKKKKMTQIGFSFI